MIHRPMLVFVSVASLHSFASAQFRLETYTCPQWSFGSVAASAGDVNGDGYVDVMVAAPSPSLAPLVRVYDGRTGAILYEYIGNDDSLGRSLGTAGDLNGDGRDEFFLGASERDLPSMPSAGVVELRDGATGTLLRTLEGRAQAEFFGTSAAAIGDVNGDGKPDLAVGATGGDIGAVNAGYVRVFSGADGAELYTLIGLGASDGFGLSVAACGDVNADGLPDFIVGAPQTSNGIAKGYARVFSGPDGALVRQLNGVAFGDWFGVKVDGAGDVNSDGFDDVIVGASRAAFGSLPDSGTGTVFSGADGSVLHVRGSVTDGSYAAVVSGGHDYDGDGVPDFALGAPVETAQSGAVRIYRGYDGALIQQILVPGTNYIGGTTEFIGDLDHDGRSDLFVGAGFAQQAFVFSFDDRVFDRACVTSPNSAGAGALIDHIGTNSVAANDLTLTAEGLPPGKSCVFFFGTSTLQVPFFDGFRCPSGQTYRLAPTLSDSQGFAAKYLDRSSGNYPIAALAAGTTWTFQVFYRDTGFGTWGVNTTDGLRIGFRP